MTPTLDGFRAHLLSTESARTVRAYFSDAAAFEAFRGGQAISLDTLEEWIATLNGRKPQTVGRKLAAVRRWMAFRARHGDTDSTAALAILAGGYQIARGARQADRRQIQPIVVEEYLAARSRAPLWGRQLMDLLWWTGARISEVLGDGLAGIPHLTVRDAVALIRDGYVRTSGKGGKVRILLLPSAGRAELTTFLAGKNPDAPLFPSSANPSRSVSAQGVNIMLHRAGLRGAHAFRHAYRARLRKCGVHDQVVKALLGHGPHDVTSAYGQVHFEEMRAAAERLSLEEKA